MMANPLKTPAIRTSSAEQKPRQSSHCRLCKNPGNPYIAGSRLRGIRPELVAVGAIPVRRASVLRAGENSGIYPKQKKYHPPIRVLCDQGVADLVKGNESDACGDLSDRDSWSAVRRRVRSTTARAAGAVRAALMRVTRRLAKAGMAGAVTPPRMKRRSAQVLQDEYRAGFPLPLPHQASATSDPHGCPWCLSLGNPDPPVRPDPER